MNAAQADQLTAAGCAAWRKYLAWGAEKRPVSAKQQAIEWHLPLDKLKAAAQALLSSSSQCATEKMKPDDAQTVHWVLQGQAMGITAEWRAYLCSPGQLCPRCGKTCGSRQLKLGVFISMKGLPLNALRQVKFDVALKAAAAPAPAVAPAAGGEAGAAQGNADVVQLSAQLFSHRHLSGTQLTSLFAGQ
jgi:hypothetical protein